MGCCVSFGERNVRLSNRHFSNLIEFTFAATKAEDVPLDERKEFLRLQTEDAQGQLWPGRGIIIEDDVPNIADRKLWARCFADTAHAIFKREVGCHTNFGWQTRAIAQAMAVSDLFVHAVQTEQGNWYPETREQTEAAVFHAGRNP